MSQPIDWGNLSPQQVKELHKHDDVNSSVDAHHHQIGRAANKVSSGLHTHDGLNSEPLLSGTTFTGSRGSNTAAILNDVLNALVLIGATNNTTA